MTVFDQTDTKLICNQVYELNKGVRNMFLCTISEEVSEWAINKLASNGIAFFCQKVPGDKGRMNLLFGKEECIEAAKLILPCKALNELTDEEDFILGMMLGYDLCKQCDRYCKRKNKKQIAQAV